MQLHNPDFSIDFPKAYDDLSLVGLFRDSVEDFIVNEHLGFTPTGDGEHCLLHIKKIGQNTHWVAQQIAELTGVDAKAIGYCGRKDRHAITEQWFSIYDPKRMVNTSDIIIEGVTLLAQTRHSHKLRPGDHESNQFIIRIKDIAIRGSKESLAKEEQNSVRSAIEQRLKQGVPNYFGPQRFGREMSNLFAANDWLEHKKLPPRQRKSMVMSAARSYLYNQILARRVLEGTWNTLIPGDISISELPTAALWGRGRLETSKEALVIEEAALADWSLWCHGLEHCGLGQERRALVLIPNNIQVNFEQTDLIVAFELAAGTFATSVLAEITKLMQKEEFTI